MSHRVVHTITTTVIWQAADDEDIRVVAEIARDMEGTIRSQFAEFLRQRKAMVKALVVSQPLGG